MKVHEAIAAALRANGIDTLFGLLGDANLFMVRSFAQDQGGRFVAAGNEAGATLMAIGYSSVSGRPGAVSVTHGPGMTNSLTALVEGVKARVPLLFLCGDTPVADKHHFQNISQRELIEATGAGFEQLESPATAMADFARALERVLREGRPIALNMPANFEWEQCEDRPLVATQPEAPTAPNHDDALDNAIGMLASARTPIVLAGRGAATPEAEQAMRRLAERSGALLATTLKGRGLFLDDPFSMGVYGTLSTPAAGDLIVQSDCVIAFGCSLNKFTGAKGPYFEGKRIIQCNIESESNSEHHEPDVSLVGDPAQICDTIVHWLDEAEIPPAGFRNDDVLRQLREDEPFADLPNTASENTVDLTRALLRINEVLPKDRTFACDVGRYVGQAWKAIDVTHPRHYIHTVHFGSIGLGLPCAIGASIAEPEKPALVVTGDGGFMLGGLTEFHTAVREACKLIVVVCNDGSYGAEYVQYEARGLDPTLSLFHWPEFAELATAMGGTGISVRTSSDLERACELIRSASGPLLIDLKLDPANMVPLDY